MPALRLLVRHAGGRDLVTLARQPEFRELDLEGGCCLLLGDLRLEGGLRLADVADPAVSVDAVFAIDLDGVEAWTVLLGRGASFLLVPVGAGGSTATPIPTTPIRQGFALSVRLAGTSTACLC